MNKTSDATPGTSGVHPASPDMQLRLNEVRASTTLSHFIQPSSSLYRSTDSVFRPSRPPALLRTETGFAGLGHRLDVAG